MKGLWRNYLKTEKSIDEKYFRHDPNIQLQKDLELNYLTINHSLSYISYGMNYHRFIASRSFYAVFTSMTSSSLHCLIFHCFFSFRPSFSSVRSFRCVSSRTFLSLLFRRFHHIQLIDFTLLINKNHHRIAIFYFIFFQLNIAHFRISADHFLFIKSWFLTIFFLWEKNIIWIEILSLKTHSIFC